MFEHWPGEKPALMAFVIHSPAFSNPECCAASLSGLKAAKWLCVASPSQHNEALSTESLGLGQRLSRHTAGGSIVRVFPYI